MRAIPSIQEFTTQTDSEQGIQIITHSAAETEQTGARLAGLLLPADILLLEGDLGTGKTTFVRGLAAGLTCLDPVSSPTFVLIHQYKGGRLGLVHADLYRLRDAEAVEGTGLYDLLGGPDITVIEWPDKLGASVPVEALTIRISLLRDDTRLLYIMSKSTEWKSRLVEFSVW